MADNTPIEWADATVNAINGCSILSPGCIHCYAMRLAGGRLRRHPSRTGLTIGSKAGPVWNGTVRLHEPALLQPLRWRRPRTIFWNAHGDTFHEAVPVEWIDRMFAAMAATPRHQHLVLTKRTARMRQYVSDLPSRVHADFGGWEGFEDTWLNGIPHRTADIWPLPNVWLGTSVEDQRRADERIPDLLATPAAGRFLSCEPLLGPIDLMSLTLPTCTDKFDALQGMGWGLLPAHHGGDRLYHGATKSRYGKIDGVIVGGESGPGARPMHPDWARQIRDDCASADVDFHFKQWGVHTPLRSDLIPVARRNIGWMQRDGRVEYGVCGDALDAMAEAEQKADRNLLTMTCRVGKKAAGRTLDDRTHDALPWRRTI